MVSRFPWFMSSQIPFLRSGIQSTPFIHRPAFRRPAPLLSFPILFSKQTSLPHPPSLPRQRGDASYNPGYSACGGSSPGTFMKQRNSRGGVYVASHLRRLAPAPRTPLLQCFVPPQTTSQPLLVYSPKANLHQSSSLTDPFGDSPTRIYSVVCVFTNHIHPVFCVLTNHILSRLLVNSPSRITQKPQFTKQPLMSNNTNQGGGQFLVLSVIPRTTK